MTIYTKLKRLENLTNSEKEIVSYIFENPEEFLASSAAQIARACYVSVPSLYRLCEKAGVAGLSEMKVQMSSDLADYLSAHTSINFDYPIKARENHDSIARILNEDYVETIKQTRSLMDMNEMHKAVRALDNAGRISIFTSAGNVYLADNFRFQMQEIGIDVHVPTDEYEARLEASRCTEKDLGIIISFGGRGLMVHMAAEILKNNHTSILLISSTEPSELTKFANIQLLICSEENHYNKISSFSTRLSILYILDNLYAGLFSQDYDANIKKKLNTYQKISAGTKAVYSKEPKE